MAETANQTAVQDFEALPLVDSRLGIALEEILRRLEQKLPPLIDYVNEALSLTGSRKIKTPAGYSIAPAKMSNHYINHICVGFSTDTSAQAPGIFKNEHTVIIYSIGERVEISEQIVQTLDRGGLIRGALLQFLTGCVDDQERLCWRLLEPQGVTFLPEAWNEYSGVSCLYKLVQPASSDNWK